MEFTHKEYSFDSMTGTCKIFAQSWAPVETDAIKGVVQVIHGMAEHAARYQDFINYLVSRGYAVFMADTANHGKSNQKPEDLGYFGEKNGYQNLVQDAKVLTDLAREAYPNRPFFVFGHSMGSFLCREYTRHYGKDVDGVIYCGTCGKNPAVGMGIQVANFVARRKGSHYRSEFIDRLAFGSYNTKFEKRTKYDWLTREQDVVNQYISDPLCGFLFTAAGYRDLFRLISAVNSRSWYEHVPYTLPICLISGEMDPVGDYGKGVRQVYEDLKKTGHTETVLKLYANGRHEILNEMNRESVFEDVANWLDNIREKKENHAAQREE